jgi:hypothetical protein
MRKLIWNLPVIFFLLIGGTSFAADTVLTWPPSGKDAILRFAIGKLRSVSAAGGQSDYIGEALAENLSTKTIPSASFYLYLVDKSGKRVGEGYLEVTNLAAGQKAKVPVSVHAMGSYASMELAAQHLPSDEPMKIRTSISSKPSGASLKLDAQDSGVTPEVLPIVPGKHVLEFSKEGYGVASTTVEIVENAMPGSVEMELSPLSVDTVILRDGTVLLGNVVSMTGASVDVTVKGKSRKLDRGRIARIIFGQHRAGAAVRSSAATQK